MIHMTIDYLCIVFLINDKNLKLDIIITYFVYGNLTAIYNVCNFYIIAINIFSIILTVLNSLPDALFFYLVIKKNFTSLKFN